jgi:dTDP-glucose 4,6-dehydratase
MRFVVLGAGGCFAQNFIRYLADEGIESFGIGRSGPKPAPFWNLPKDFRFWQLHLVNQLDETLRILDVIKPEIIVNFAAQGEGAASFRENAPDFFETNTTALVRLVLALRNRDYLRRFIQIGSSEVYGSVKEAAQETSPLCPTSPYSISKAAFDQYLDCMWRTAKFPHNIIRPSNCYTEGQQLYRIIPKAFVTALKKEKLPLHGGGMAVKSYLHANDLSKAILLVAKKAPIGAIYNVGPEQPIAIRGIVRLISKIVGVEWDDFVEEVGDRVGQDARYELNCDAIKELGWKEELKLWPGLHTVLNWVQTYPELLTMPTTYEHRA